MTNYEKIKSMSIEDMADKMDDIIDCANCPKELRLYCDTFCNSEHWCNKVIKQWLNSEVKDNEN